jgi:transcription initiation factor TFIID subunit 5
LEFHIISRYLNLQIDRKLPHDSSLIQKGLYAKPEPNAQTSRTIDKIIDDTKTFRISNVKRPASDEIEDINIIKKKVNSTSLSLPSICCYTFKNSDDGITHMNINPDASILLACFSNSVIRLWKNINSPTQRGKGICKSVYDSYPYSFYEDFDYMRNKARNSSIKLIGHAGPVYGTCFSENSEYLLSVSQDKIVRLWDMNKNQNIVNYYGHNYPIWDVTFSPHDLYFATASNDRTARLWKSDHIYPLRIFAGHFSDVNTIKFHPNVNYLATGSEDCTSRFWDIQTGKCVRLFKGHKGPIYSIAVSPDGKTVVTGSEDKTIKIWDIGSGNCIKTFEGHDDIVCSLDFNENGKILASGSSDNTVRLWDIDNLRQKSDDSLNKIESNQTIDIQLSISDLMKQPNPLNKKNGDKKISKEMINLYLTKSSPIYRVRYTERNLLYALCEYRSPVLYSGTGQDSKESSPVSTPTSTIKKEI